MNKIKKSKELFERAKNVIPGGVNSPVRAFKSVGGTPLFIRKAFGSKIYDIDGNRYIDYVGSWGPHLFGHQPEFIMKAVRTALKKSSSFGAPTEIEVRLAELICEMVPSVEMVRMVNSGTEATMSAIRLARAFTGKEKIIKFEGCYHGHSDSFLIKAGSGLMTLNHPSSPGVTQSVSKDTLIAKFNNIESVKNLFEENKDQIAAVIIEPIAGNMGVVPAKKEFLEKLRKICTENNTLLIFDEVMTGFRVAKGGSQELFSISPDLTTFGKIIGGGLPVGAFGGKKSIMEMLSPLGPVYQAGTLSGNPLAMSAGFAALSNINKHPDIYLKLEDSSSYLANGISEISEFYFKNMALNRVGSMFSLFFTDKEVTDYDSALSSNTELFAKFFHSLLRKKIYIAPSQFEAWFVSTAHTKEDLEITLDMVTKTFKEIMPSND